MKACLESMLDVMMSTSMSSLLSTAAVAGVATHQAFYIRGDWERHTPVVAGTYTILPLSILAFLLILGHLTVGHAIAILATLSAGYLLGLFGSIVTYRLLFHPLKGIPGPVGAKLSGFWSALSSVPSFKFHLQVQDLHQTYGDFVRIRMHPMRPQIIFLSILTMK